MISKSAEHQLIVSVTKFRVRKSAKPFFCEKVGYVPSALQTVEKQQERTRRVSAHN